MTRTSPPPSGPPDERPQTAPPSSSSERGERTTLPLGSHGLATAPEPKPGAPPGRDSELSIPGLPRRRDWRLALLTVSFITLSGVAAVLVFSKFNEPPRAVVTESTPTEPAAWASSMAPISSVDGAADPAVQNPEARAPSTQATPSAQALPEQPAPPSSATLEIGVSPRSASTTPTLGSKHGSSSAAAPGAGRPGQLAAATSRTVAATPSGSARPALTPLSPTARPAPQPAASVKRRSVFDTPIQPPAQ